MLVLFVSPSLPVVCNNVAYSEPQWFGPTKASELKKGLNDM